MDQNPKETLARELFFSSDKTQKNIAQSVGVSEKTIYLWMKAGDWKKLKSAGRRMPMLIVENMYAQIQELNDDIRTRPPGKRYPTTQEAEIMRKLIISLGRVKQGYAQPENMQMMQGFLTWMHTESFELTKTMTPYADKYLKLTDSGFLPFDIEEEPEPEEEIPLLRGDVPQTTDVVSEQGCVPPSPAPQPDQQPISRHPELVSGTSHNTEPLALNTPETHNTSSPLERLGEVLPATTGNETETSYDSPTATSHEIEQGKAETHLQPEIGISERVNNELNNTPSPLERLGEVSVHIPGITYRDRDGQLKLIPPYKSEEYWNLPGNIRERLYTMGGEPIKDRKVSSYF